VCVCVLNLNRRAISADSTFGWNRRRTSANLCPIIFMEENRRSVHSRAASRRLRHPSIGKSSELLKCAAQHRYTKRRKLDGKLENSVGGLNPTSRVQPRIQLALEASGAEFNTVLATIRSSRCDATDDAPCVPIEINPIPLLMIRYYCSHFRGVFPRTIVQSAPSSLAFNWLQMTVWLALSRSHAPFPGINARYKSRHRAVSVCLRLW